MPVSVQRYDMIIIKKKQSPFETSNHVKQEQNLVLKKMLGFFFQTNANKIKLQAEGELLLKCREKKLCASVGIYVFI